MDLKTYFKTTTQDSLAKALGVTPGAVNQWVSGLTTVSAERCIQIEQATGGQVRCEDLRPDVAWEVLRCNPELATQSQPTTQGA
jgi:DNA-binding transcriptional regulator YdaS (Cro superfamily)